VLRERKYTSVYLFVETNRCVKWEVYCV